MAGSSLMSLGTQALTTAYAQLQTTGNNIANANTPGYSRQSVQQRTLESQYTGSGYIGRGVTVASVTRAANMFLTQQAVATQSAAAADGARSTMLQQLEKVFGSGAAGLGHAATQVFNAFADVATAPADLSARQAVLGRLQEFASLARAQSDQVEALQANVRNDVTGGIDTVNTLAAELAKLNVQVAAATNRGQMPNDLLDQRDQLISRIAEQVELHTVVGPDQQVSVFIANGQTLVLGSTANRLVLQPDAADPSRAAVGMLIGGQTVPIPDGGIGEGSLGGLLRFQNGDLVDARQRLNDLVAGVATALEDQQRFGMDLQGRGGLDAAGDPNPTLALFEAFDPARAAATLKVSLTDPRGLAAASPVTAVVSKANTGSVAVAALDVVADPASAYEALTLRFSADPADPTGTALLVDLLDAGGAAVLPQAAYTPGQAIVHNGVSLTLAGVPRPGDSIALARTANPAANNGNALSFDSLASRLLVDGQTASDAYASLLTEVGVRVQGARASAETTATVAASASAELSGKTGVNLDEEAARLLQYQQAYQAAAKMLQTAQTLMDAIIAMGR